MSEPAVQLPSARGPVAGSPAAGDPAVEATAADPARTRRCRVLIVSASMGGGHDAVGRELVRRLTQRGHTACMLDFLDALPRRTGTRLRGAYAGMLDRTPWLYEAIYRLFFLPPQRRGMTVRPVTAPASRALLRWVATHRPDVVVSTFHLAGQTAGRLREHGRLPCPAVTFVTNFAVHSLWPHPGTDLHLCLTADAAAQVRRRVPGGAVVTGPVLRPDIGPRPTAERHRMRTALGVDDDERLVLVSAGSWAVGEVAATARALRRVPGAVPLVLCGRNERLRARLDAEDHVRGIGWVEDTSALLAAADAVVDNAAGLSSMEAMAAGVPVIAHQPIPGHGRHNVQRAAALGLLAWARTREELTAHVQRALAGGDGVARSRHRVLPDGDAAAEILALAGGAAPHIRRAPAW